MAFSGCQVEFLYTRKKFSYMSDLPLKEELNTLLFSYFKSYYLDELGLSNWQTLINNFRLNEEELTAQKLLKYFKKFNLPPISSNSNVLIVGSGTGAELFFLSKLYPDANFYGIDRNSFL